MELTNSFGFSQQHGRDRSGTSRAGCRPGSSTNRAGRLIILGPNGKEQMNYGYVIMDTLLRGSAAMKLILENSSRAIYCINDEQMMMIAPRSGPAAGWLAGLSNCPMMLFIGIIIIIIRRLIWDFALASAAPPPPLNIETKPVALAAQLKSNQWRPQVFNGDSLNWIIKRRKWVIIHATAGWPERHHGRENNNLNSRPALGADAAWPALGSQLANRALVQSFQVFLAKLQHMLLFLFHSNDNHRGRH